MFITVLDFSSDSSSSGIYDSSKNNMLYVKLGVERSRSMLTDCLSKIMHKLSGAKV